MKIITKIKNISLAAIVISAVLGVLFIAFPDKCITYISLALGIGLIVLGIAGIISYFADKGSAFSLAMGIIVAVVGVIICTQYKAIISLVVILFGVFLLVSGLFNFATAIKVIVSSVLFGWVTLGLSVVTTALGVIAITKSSELSVTIVQFIGVALIVYAVLDIFAFVQVRMIARDVKNAVNSINDIEVEGTIVEENDE